MPCHAAVCMTCTCLSIVCACMQVVCSIYICMQGGDPKTADGIPVHLMFQERMLAQRHACYITMHESINPLRSMYLGRRNPPKMATFQQMACQPSRTCVPDSHTSQGSRLCGKNMERHVKTYRQEPCRFVYDKVVQTQRKAIHRCH